MQSSIVRVYQRPCTQRDSRQTPSALYSLVSKRRVINCTFFSRRQIIALISQSWCKCPFDISFTSARRSAFVFSYVIAGNNKGVTLSPPSAFKYSIGRLQCIKRSKPVVISYWPLLRTSKDLTIVLFIDSSQGGNSRSMKLRGTVFGGALCDCLTLLFRFSITSFTFPDVGFLASPKRALDAPIYQVCG